MARPRTLPEDNAELERLLHRHTQVEVANMYGVTEQAVSAAIRDRKLNTERRVSYRDYIPWSVRTEHSEDYQRRMLRYYAMEQMARPLTPKQARSLELFKSKMDSMGAHGAVIHYDPEHPKGPWFCLPRRPGVDVGYVRNPEVP